MSESALAEALVRIHAKLKNPGFDSENPHFRNKYISLAGCRNAIAPVAAEEGVFISQNLTTTEGGVACSTILTHKSGATMTFGPLALPAAKQDPQGFGSCATYARRYSLLAAFNLVGDDDDDANAGTAAYQPKTVQKPVVAAAKPKSNTKYSAAAHPENELIVQARKLMWDAQTLPKLNEVMDRVNVSDKFSDDEKRLLIDEFKRRADRIEQETTVFG